MARSAPPRPPVSSSSAARALRAERPLRLPLDEPEAATATNSRGKRALEAPQFPFEELSDIAEVESWRKEINRPLSHIHKWWAQRLGSVFRAMAIAAFSPPDADVLGLMYRPVRFPGNIVFDPFMGSGTTLVEAVKLGIRAVGRDINPVAYFLVRNALSEHDRATTLETFRGLERDVADDLRRLYATTLPDGTDAEVLYFFWVMTTACPGCTKAVDLFSSYVFARNAYPKRVPEARAVCPRCGAINLVLHDAELATCCGCTVDFNPQVGPARGQKASCPHCSASFQIAKTIRETRQAPRYRLYAKLVLLRTGDKEYFATSPDDERLYAAAADSLASRTAAYPTEEIAPGHNTDQALGYNFRRWHQMFNARQLLSLSMLAERIRGIPDEAQRELFTCLFSGMLEFNNMFASYKGEGTGAVRHMFAHHILKPERTPLEANVWGTPKSSGSFSTMFDGRIRRAIDYAETPFEIRPKGSGERGGGKVYGLSERIGARVAGDAQDFAAGREAYLSCGDSSQTDLPDGSVDAVLTDPPFFDNVHYSQLADFFHVWQRHILGESEHRAAASTRQVREVQNADGAAFTDRLTGVWREARRVLRDDGLLAFTYHHSRPEGWTCVLSALMDAEFVISAVHPVKAEMSVAMPKHQAAEPIDLDVIVVCRKRAHIRQVRSTPQLLDVVRSSASEQVNRFAAVGRRLSRNDVRVVVMSHAIRELSSTRSKEAALEELAASSAAIDDLIDSLSTVRRQSTEPSQ